MTSNLHLSTNQIIVLYSTYIYILLKAQQKFKGLWCEKNLSGYGGVIKYYSKKSTGSFLWDIIDHHRYGVLRSISQDASCSPRSQIKAWKYQRTDSLEFDVPTDR
jgi:hypothetical protein